MKFWFLLAIAVSTLAAAQTPANAPPTTLNFENGVIANSTYSNECLGFSLPIPTGWKVDESIIPGGKARHLSNNSLVLLFLRKDGDSFGRIILSASAPPDGNSTAQDFVSSAVHEQVKLSPDRELVRDATAVDYGSQHFFRADYKGVRDGKQPVYFAYVYSKFRGYMIGETIVSGSPQGLDETATALHGVSFQQDQINPKCVMAPDQLPAKKDKPQRVRVSSRVAVGLLVKKVNPRYPDDARHARIQGQVVIQAEINKDGDVESLMLISGHPALAPAAMEAVKQWRYKPYLLEGLPMAVETQIIVNFTLSEF